MTKLKITIHLFHWNGKTPFWKWPYNHLFYPNLTIRCQKVENRLSHTNSKLCTNLTGWKTEYLIAQVRAEIWRKVFWLKTCPQGVLQAQYEEKYFVFLPLPILPARLKILHLSWGFPIPQTTSYFASAGFGNMEESLGC